MKHPHMLQKLYLPFLLTISLSISPSFQWSMQGHSIIAAIAQTKILSESPELFQKILKMLEGLEGHFPESKSSLLEAAAMPDLLSFKFSNFLMPNHFIDRPIIYTKDKESDVKIPNPIQSENVIHTLSQAVEIILQSFDSQNDQTISNGFMDSLMLRYLIHLVGDCHQPLHTSALYSKSLFGGSIISGDQGGNLISVFNLFDKGKVTLHKMYDDAFGSFNYQKLSFPYSKKLKKKINLQAKYLTSKFPESFFEEKVKNMDFNQWSLEGFDIAKNFVYSQVELFPFMKPEYIILGRFICQKRMTLAGYRLARLLKAIFSNKVEERKFLLKRKVEFNRENLI